MSDLQMQKIKELQIFKVFVSMATKLSNRQIFYKTAVISKQIHVSYFCTEKYEQVAQRATIAHLRANCTFPYCKSMGDDDPLGLAN